MSVGGQGPSAASGSRQHRQVDQQGETGGRVRGQERRQEEEGEEEGSAVSGRSEQHRKQTPCSHSRRVPRPHVEAAAEDGPTGDPGRRRRRRRRPGLGEGGGQRGRESQRRQEDRDFHPSAAAVLHDGQREPVPRHLRESRREFQRGPGHPRVDSIVHLAGRVHPRAGGANGESPLLLLLLLLLLFLLSDMKLRCH